MAKFKLKHLSRTDSQKFGSGEFSYVDVGTDNESHGNSATFTVWSDGEVGIAVGGKGLLLRLQEIDELLKLRRRVIRGLKEEELVG